MISGTRLNLVLSWSFWLAGWILPSILIAQPRFIVELDSREVVAGEPFQVRFTLENGQGTNFRPPDWNGLEVIQGPSRSIQSTFINGQMSSQASYIYLVSAPKPGNYSLGSAAIEVDRRTLSSGGIEIRAVKAKASIPGNETNSGDPYFITATLDTSEVFVGQQVTLEYKLYTKVEVNSYETLKAPSFQGLYIRGLPQFNVNTQRETLNGQVYSTRVLRRLALFPQQSGQIVIDPMLFQIGVVSRDPLERTLFFSARIRPVQLSSPTLELNVKSLPSPTPENYCGAVGAFGLSTSWDKSRVAANDALSLKLNISGDGDPKMLVAPELDLGENMEVFPPNLISEDVNETSGRALISKTWEYVIIPSQQGKYNLSFNLSYFDPDSNAYLTRTTSSWPLTVTPGTGFGNTDQDRSLGAYQMHPPDLWSDHQPKHSLWWNSLVFWILFSIPVTVGMIVARIHFLHKKEAGSKPEDRRYKKARKEAQSRLDEARKSLDSGDAASFYRAVSSGFLGYAAHRLKVSPNNVRRDDMRSYLSAAGISDKVIEHFIQFWDQMDMAQYAPSSDRGALRSVYEKAVLLISELESTLEKI